MSLFVNKALPKPLLLLLFPIASCFLVALITSKIFFTDLGLESIGRMFHYFISYQDFGVIKRGLLGSALQPLYMGLKINPYVFYLAVNFAFSISLIAVFWSFFNKRLAFFSRLDACFVAFPIIFSPALAMHLGYSLGNFDNTLMLVFLISLLLIKHDHTLMASVFSALAIAIHEIYLFTSLPFLMWFIGYKTGSSKFNILVIKKGISFSFLPIITACYFVFFGCLGFAKDDYLKSLTFISQELIKRDGYFELTSTLTSNFNAAFISLANIENWPFVPIVIIYAFFFSYFIYRILQKADIKMPLLLCLAILSPLLLSFVANDVYRWFCFSLFLMAVLPALFLSTEIYKDRKLKLTWVVLMLFTLLGPVGNVFNNRPFPVFQTLFNLG